MNWVISGSCDTRSVSARAGEHNMWTETARQRYRREDLRYASDMTRRGIGVDRAAYAGGQAARTAAPGAVARRVEACCIVAHRRALASPAAQFSQPLDGTALLLCLASRGRGKRLTSCCCNRPANGRGARPAQACFVEERGRGDRQPIGQDHGKRRPPGGYPDAGKKITRRKRHISPIQPGIWWRRRSMPPTFRTATGLRRCSPRSATCSRGCATSLPMAGMPARSWRRRWPDRDNGGSKSSSAPIAPPNSKCCRGAGWSSEPWPG